MKTKTNGWVKMFLEGDVDARTYIKALKAEGVKSIGEQEGGVSGAGAGAAVTASDFSIYNSKDAIKKYTKPARQQDEEEDDGKWKGLDEEEDMVLSDDQFDAIDTEADLPDEDELQDDDQPVDEPTDDELDDEENRAQLYDDELQEEADPISLFDKIFDAEKE